MVRIYKNLTYSKTQCKCNSGIMHFSFQSAMGCNYDLAITDYECMHDIASISLVRQMFKGGGFPCFPLSNACLARKTKLLLGVIIVSVNV